jgi:hypothetical protein
MRPMLFMSAVAALLIPRGMRAAARRMLASAPRQAKPAALRVG